MGKRDTPRRRYTPSEIPLDASARRARSRARTDDISPEERDLLAMLRTLAPSDRREVETLASLKAQLAEARKRSR